jgi:hypothetical protein
MATAHSTSMRRPSRNRPSKPRPRTNRSNRKPLSNKSKPVPAPPRIRGRLLEFLNSELEFLLKTRSLLLCVAKSMDDRSHPATGPFYPDILEMASELVMRRANSLDELMMEGRVREIAGL